MKIKISVDYKIFIFLVMIVFTPMDLVLAYNLSEYYPLAQGNKWTYSVIEEGETDKETIWIEGTEMVGDIRTIIMHYSEDAYKCLAFDSGDLKLYKDFDENLYTIFNPPIIEFPNIEIGVSKSYSGNSITYNIEGLKINESNQIGQIKLEAEEDVEVPAGRFTDCLRFSSTSEYEEVDGEYKDDCTVWLAPGVGKVKEFCVKGKRVDKEEYTHTSLGELTSALIDGKQIGSPEQ